MSEFRRRLSKGSWLQLIVLRVLYENSLHGYKLLKQVNVLMSGRRKLKAGSLYTILRRMEHNGLLDSVWEEKSARMNRRIYNLTEKGIERLKQGKNMIEEQQKILNEMIKFYESQFKDD